MYREYIIREIERKGFRVSPYQQVRMQLKALIDIDSRLVERKREAFA